MKIVIVGCGRVGSTLAENLDADCHEVIIFDIQSSAFDRLPETFKGSAVRGDGTDEEVLRRAGAADADVFLALTEGDNRNIMAAQLAIEALAIPKVIAKINDPVRAAAYSELGLVTLCRTNLMVDSVATYLKQTTIPELSFRPGPGIDIPEGSPHEHPHPTAAPRLALGRTILPNAARSAGAEGSPSRSAGDVGKTERDDAGDGQAAGPGKPVDAIRAQRLGFRRRRS
jgi:trk system potassium uptake protein TrkA